MYVSPDFKTKKDFKAAVESGRQLEVYNPSGMFPAPQNGTTTVQRKTVRELSMRKAYYLLLEEAFKSGLPQFYKDDLLVHDRKQLEDEDFQNFLWMVRVCGTHLVNLEKRDAYTLAYELQHCFEEWEHQWYHYSNGTLRKVTFEEIMGFRMQL